MLARRGPEAATWTAYLYCRAGRALSFALSSSLVQLFIHTHIALGLLVEICDDSKFSHIASNLHEI